MNNSSVLEPDALAKFVDEVDSYGGPDAPASQALLASFEYQPRIKIDQDLDPLSDLYIEQQMALYRELSGRELDAKLNELVDFNLHDHINTPNPYGTAWSPSNIALHYARLSKAVRHADLRSGASVLDLGCGWGLTTEFMALLGCKVTGVDINQAFVDLVNTRNTVTRLDLKAEWGSFDTYEPDDTYDAILFYECFHHAMAPWDLIRRARRWLKPDGKIILAGEPIQDIWWRHWGMRLDGLSLYCIRKFGWFESGWSMPFLINMFTNYGFGVGAFADQDGHIGNVVIAKKVPHKLIDDPFVNLSQRDGWVFEGDMLISLGNSTLWVDAPDKTTNVTLQILNCRGRKMRMSIWLDNQSQRAITLMSGPNDISLKCTSGSHRVAFSAEKWCPDDEMGNGDSRHISFHLTGLEFS